MLSEETLNALHLVSWNIAHRLEPWRLLAGAGFDVALLQEAGPPPRDVETDIETNPGPWETQGQGSRRPWRTAVARLSDRVRLSVRPTAPLDLASGDDLPVSRMGTLAVADVEVLETGERLTVASAYGLWESPIPSVNSPWIYADATVHRVLSDLSALIGEEKLPPLLVAGDLNVYLGYGDKGSDYWKERYAAVFARAAALGLRFVGPQAPEAECAARPRPAEVPPGSRNVPTLRTKEADPTSAQRQLDFVFASEALSERISVRALNGEEEWGPSDHCRVAIDLRLE